MNPGVVVRRLLTTALTGLAFWNSYTHTVDWFEKHGQPDAASVLALIPEAGLILALLFLASGQLTAIQRWLVGLVGCGSIGITISANLAGASGGTEKVAALVAPVFAILGFALEITGPATDAGPAPDLAKATRPPKVRAATQPAPMPDTQVALTAKATPPEATYEVAPRQPEATKPKTKKATRATDDEVRAHIRHLINTGALPDQPSRNQLVLAIRGTPRGRNKEWCSAHAKDLAAQAEASAQQAG